MDRPVGTRSTSPSPVEAGGKQERPKLTKVSRSKPSIPPVVDRQRPTSARQAIVRDEPSQTNRRSLSTGIDGRQQPEPFRLLPPIRSRSNRSSQTLTPPVVRRSVVSTPIERPKSPNRSTSTIPISSTSPSVRPSVAAISQVNQPAERTPTPAPNRLRQSSPAVPTISSISRPDTVSVPQGNERERPQVRANGEDGGMTPPSKKLHELPSTLKQPRSRPMAALPERTVEKTESRSAPSVPEIVISRGSRPQPVTKPLQDRSTTGQYRSGELTPPGRVKPIGGQPPTRTTTGRTLRVGDL